MFHQHKYITILFCFLLNGYNGISKSKEQNNIQDYQTISKHLLGDWQLQGFRYCYDSTYFNNSNGKTKFINYKLDKDSMFYPEFAWRSILHFEQTPNDLNNSLENRTWARTSCNSCEGLGWELINDSSIMLTIGGCTEVECKGERGIFESFFLNRVNGEKIFILKDNKLILKTKGKKEETIFKKIAK